MVKANARVDDNIVILDLREVEEIVSGNRFVIYSLFPDTNISIRVIWGRLKQNVVLTVGHSITNRTCQTNVGSLMLMYNGGGHPRVGTCQVPTPDGERCLQEIIERSLASTTPSGITKETRSGREVDDSNAARAPRRPGRSAPRTEPSPR